VSGGENKSIATQPLRVTRIKCHDFLVQEIGQWRQANGGSGVAISHLFHGVSGKNLRDGDGVAVVVRKN
jgi:hypothetical protein